MYGFISIERFSFWEDEKSLIAWKKNFDHLNAQKKVEILSL